MDVVAWDEDDDGDYRVVARVIYTQRPSRDLLLPEIIIYVITQSTTRDTFAHAVNGRRAFSTRGSRVMTSYMCRL